MKGGMSGGTFGTLLVISKQSRDPSKAAVLRDPYALSPSKLLDDIARDKSSLSPQLIIGGLDLHSQGKGHCQAVLDL